MRGQQSCWIWSEAAPPWPRVLSGSLWKSLSLYFDKSLFLFLPYRISKANAMNLLYYFERSNIQNYVLLGEGWGLSYNFAMRGYPVVDSELL
ncbi:hypothetical protein AMTRI_Chr05g57430 [Amborella trichopoda]